MVYLILIFHNINFWFLYFYEKYVYIYTSYIHIQHNFE